jgi:hypothetical protein
MDINVFSYLSIVIAFLLMTWCVLKSIKTGKYYHLLVAFCALSSMLLELDWIINKTTSDLKNIAWNLTDAGLMLAFLMYTSFDD